MASSAPVGAAPTLEDANRRWARVSTALAGYALFGGSSSFLGWVLDIPRLADWDGDGIAIQPNAAVCAVLGGAALVCLSLRKPRFALGRAFAVVMVLVAGFTLLETVSGLDLGIDTLLLFGRRWGSLAVVSPGRMGVSASTCSMLLGVGLLLVGRRQWTGWMTALALVPLGISSLAALGYVYRTDPLYSMPRLTAIALQTATFIMALAFGLVTRFPKLEPMRTILDSGSAGIQARRLLPFLILVPIGLGLLELRIQRGGWLDSVMGTSLLIVSIVALLLGLTWSTLFALRRHEGALRSNQENLRRTNQELSVERQKLETIIRKLPLGLAITDAHGNPLSMNEAALHMYGFASEAEMAADLESYPSLIELRDLDGALVPFEDWPAPRAWRSDFVTNRPYRLRNLRPNTECVVELSVVPIHDANGTVALLIFLLQDVTERKQTERALQEAMQRLVEADQRKDEFLAVLSHELRNPLAPITSGIYVLEHAASGSEETKVARQIIERQVRQLTRLVEDLLDVTRITRGKIHLQKSRLDLNELVRRTVDDHRPLFDESGLGLEFEPAPAAIFVEGDPSRLGQMLGNLLQNAVKFTPRGGRVGITLEAVPAAKSVELRVADTGFGMTPEVLNQIFEPFVQADRTLDRSKGGLGLGLTLVKGIVELHGGSVSAYSGGLGQGSEFRIRLPLGVPEPLPSETPGSPRLGSRRRVLVIEDNVDYAESLQLLLRMFGHEVEIAHDGRSGLAKARTLHPEVLLCDVGLPGMTGYEVAQAFRNDSLLRDTFLVALTGYASPHDVQRALDAGFDRHLAKPPTLDKLDKLMAELPSKSARQGV